MHRIVRAGRRRADARILYYHRIDDEMHRSCVAPGAFREQMRYLREHGYRILSLTELDSALTHHQPFAPRTVAITFDDGFADNYHRAYPILHDLDVPATVFIAVGAVGGTLRVLRDRPDGLPALTWSQIREMQRGGVTIGSHTISHARLTDLPPADLDRELIDSRAIIAEETGTDPVAFCYPRGAFDHTVRDAVRRAGYRIACTTRAGGVSTLCDPLILPRTFIARDDTLVDFARKLDGAFDYLHHGVALLRRQRPGTALA